MLLHVSSSARPDDETRLQSVVNKLFISHPLITSLNGREDPGRRKEERREQRDTWKNLKFQLVHFLTSVLCGNAHGVVNGEENQGIIQVKWIDRSIGAGGGSSTA